MRAVDSYPAGSRASAVWAVAVGCVRGAPERITEPAGLAAGIDCFLKAPMVGTFVADVLTVSWFRAHPAGA